MSVMSTYTFAVSEFMRKRGTSLTWLIPWTWLQLIATVFYVFVQHCIIAVFKPSIPPSEDYPTKPYGKIAIIGAGLTGISSASHCIGHNFEVTIFEQKSREKGLGGIWRNVNRTSGLQLNSILYRFHPSVLWECGFPERDEILGQIEKIWHEYNLESRTKFDTPITSVKRAPKEMYDSHKDNQRSRWIINNDESTLYDAVIVTIGTCGPPMFPKWAQDYIDARTNEAQHEGKHEDSRKPIIVHSSELDTLEEGVVRQMKRIVVVGSGASGVEGVEWVMDHIYGTKRASPTAAPEVLMLARSDKWIIPRNFIIDTLIACQPFGREMPLSFIWEGILKHMHYHGVENLVPDDGRGLFTGTPVVNDTFLGHVRDGKCKYVRGETLKFSDDGKGVVFKDRLKDKEGEERVIEADLIVLATGFEHPSIDFFDDEETVFPKDYERPNLYLQNFSTEDWSVLTTNSAYMNAIGTVGHFHIGIYTRILLTLLMDPAARPSPKDMKLWVDAVRFVKSGSQGAGLGFFTYAELTIWLLAFHLFRPDRLRWIFFIMQGWGVHGPRK